MGWCHSPDKYLPGFKLARKSQQFLVSYRFAGPGKDWACSGLKDQGILAWSRMLARLLISRVNFLPPVNGLIYMSSGQALLAAAAGAYTPEHLYYTA